MLQGLKNYLKMLQGLKISKKCCKVQTGPDLASEFCCKVFLGLFSSSSGQAPENDAAKDTVVADDDASSAVPQRAAQDLLSAWTASDLDALDAASDACYHAPSSSDSTNNGSSSRAKNAKQASRHRRHPAIAGIPPLQAGTDTRHEAVAGGRSLQARGGIPSGDGPV